MASAAHQTLLFVLREEPHRLVLLLRALGHRVPPGALAVADSTVRSELRKELRPNLLFVHATRRWWAVEVQRQRDPRKRTGWPLLNAILNDRFGTPGALIVLTHRADVVRWARTVGHARGPFGSAARLTPVVLALTGPRLRALLDPAQPELALFAAWGVHHRYGPTARRIVQRARAITELLPERQRDAQERAILACLHPRMLKYFQEPEMDINKIPEGPVTKGLKAMGRAEGKAEGKAEGVLHVLAAWTVPVTTTQRARILACRDLATLDRWLARAALATHVADVLDAP